jgi:phosphoribosylglycinamide formyltransferase 1
VGVGFSDLRQIALTFCHRIVIRPESKIQPPGNVDSGILSGSRSFGDMNKLAIFSSGTGSNAARIIRYFQGHPSISVDLIVCNNPEAGVLGVGKEHGVKSLLIEKERFFRGDGYVAELQARGIGFIVLAGFLWKIPSKLVAAFSHRIINIHPALLPKYGGKGMYGHFVHEAVIAAREQKSGITIHFVDELYDHGQIIFQQSVDVDPRETPTTLAKKVQSLEHEFFPLWIEKVITGNLLNPR